MLREELESLVNFGTTLLFATATTTGTRWFWKFLPEQRGFGWAGSAAPGLEAMRLPRPIPGVAIAAKPSIR